MLKKTLVVFFAIGIILGCFVGSGMAAEKLIIACDISWACCNLRRNSVLVFLRGSLLGYKKDECC